MLLTTTSSTKNNLCALQDSRPLSPGQWTSTFWKLFKRIPQFPLIYLQFLVFSSNNKAIWFKHNIIFQIFIICYQHSSYIAVVQGFTLAAPQMEIRCLWHSLPARLLLISWIQSEEISMKHFRGASWLGTINRGLNLKDQMKWKDKREDVCYLHLKK